MTRLRETALSAKERARLENECSVADRKLLNAWATAGIIVLTARVSGKAEL